MKKIGIVCIMGAVFWSIGFGMLCWGFSNFWNSPIRPSFFGSTSDAIALESELLGIIVSAFGVVLFIFGLIKAFKKQN